MNDLQGMSDRPTSIDGPSTAALHKSALFTEPGPLYSESIESIRLRRRFGQVDAKQILQSCRIMTEMCSRSSRSGEGISKYTRNMFVARLVLGGISLLGTMMYCKSTSLGGWILQLACSMVGRRSMQRSRRCTGSLLQSHEYQGTAKMAGGSIL